MQEKWNDLVVQNPMLIEITRFRRRYFSFKGSNSVNAVVLTLVLICYATLVLIVVDNRTAFSPINLIEFEMGFLTLFAPMMLYGAIAGERERRSWDLLLAAPISKAQIVAGKFIGAMTALGIAIVFFQVPILITAFSNKESKFGSVLVAELVSISFVMNVCALTILFSARVKRGLMALGATLGILMCGLVVFPSLIGFGGSDRRITDVSLYLHPFYVVGRIQDASRVYGLIASGGYTYGSTEDRLPPTGWGILQIAVYLGLTITCLIWATKTLNFAENEVKFLPQGKKDA